MQVFAILIQPGIATLSILPELDGMPAVGFLEAGKAHGRHARLFRSKEPFESFDEPICQHLDCRGRYMVAPTTFESSGQIVLRWERAILLVLYADMREHLIIELAGLCQAAHEQMGLFLIHEQTVLKCSHVTHCAKLVTERQVFPQDFGRPITHIAKAWGPQAALWKRLRQSRWVKAPIMLETREETQ